MLGKCCLPNLIRYLPYTIEARNVTLVMFKSETNTCINTQNTQRHYDKMIKFFLEDYYYDFFAYSLQMALLSLLLSPFLAYCALPPYSCPLLLSTFKSLKPSPLLPSPFF